MRSCEMRGQAVHTKVSLKSVGAASAGGLMGTH